MPHVRPTLTSLQDLWNHPRFAPPIPNPTFSQTTTFQPETNDNLVCQHCNRTYKMKHYFLEHIQKCRQISKPAKPGTTSLQEEIERERNSYISQAQSGSAQSDSTDVAQSNSHVTEEQSPPAVSNMEVPPAGSSLVTRAKKRCCKCNKV